MENKDKENRFLYNDRALKLFSFLHTVTGLRKDAENHIDGTFVMDCLKAYVQSVYNNDEELVDIIRKFFDGLAYMFPDKVVDQQDLVYELGNLEEHIFYLVQKELE